MRYEARNQRLILVSWHTGSVIRELETSLVASEATHFWWSPTCRYLAGIIDDELVIWDAINGGRVRTFSNDADLTLGFPFYNISWNPEGDSLVFRRIRQAYLWHFTQSDPISLSFSGDIPPAGMWGRAFYVAWQVEWDNQRDQVLLTHPDANGDAIVAYDQRTGQQITFFHNAGQEGALIFRITPDDRSVLVFTAEEYSVSSYLKAITVWDRDTMEHVTVDANTQSAVLPTEVALSPNKRYLVLARLGTMRVWDLNNLAPNINDRDPIARYKIEPNTVSVRFVSETVVETTNFQEENQHWDVLTGEPAP